MKLFTRLKKNLKNDFSGFKEIKIAVLGDTSTQFLVQALRGTGYDHNLNLEVWEADFNQIERQELQYILIILGYQLQINYYRKKVRIDDELSDHKRR